MRKYEKYTLLLYLISVIVSIIDLFKDLFKQTMKMPNVKISITSTYTRQASSVRSFEMSLTLTAR